MRLKIEGEGGRVEHSELEYGEAIFRVSSLEADKFPHAKSPSQAGGGTKNIMVYVDDADAHCAQARAAGAVIVREAETQDYGADYWTDRGYEVRDPEGHGWWFTKRLQTAPGAR